MGKRLQRYFFNQFPKQLETLYGKEAGVVMKDGVSFFGTIIRKEGNFLLIEDKIPRRHSLTIENIYEIVVDSEANY